MPPAHENSHVDWEVVVSTAAEQDFRSILRWTTEHFGTAQSRRYREILQSAISRLKDGPLLPGSRSIAPSLGGLRMLNVRREGSNARHVVIYRASGEDTIEVLRILHDSMDFVRHLKLN